MKARAGFPRLDEKLLQLLAQASPREIEDALRAMTPRQRDLVKTHFARTDLREFVRQAWPIVEPAHRLVWGWHYDAICEHLDAVYRGWIRKLLINVPPRHGKSTLVSIMFPAWTWTHSPQWRFLCGSYSAELATEHSMDCRRIIESDWYSSRFMSTWSLEDDQNAKDHFSTTASGHRISIGVAGGGTGLGCTCAIIDDPLKAEDAYSDAERARAIRWIKETMSTRFDDPETGRTVGIMQRLSADDPSAFMESSGDYECLILPSEFEVSRRCITYANMGRGRVEFYRDPRKEEGDLLFEKRFSKKVLEAAKGASELGPDGFAAQHQQRPSPKGGGMFKVNNWRFWRWRDEPDVSGLRPDIGGAPLYKGPARTLDRDDLEEVLVSVDATFKKTKKGSYVAIHVWGKLGSRRLLLERVHRRMDFNATVQELVGTNPDVEIGGILGRWPEARRKLIEAKANGDAIADTLENKYGISGIERINPGDASKEQRANAMLTYQASNNCELHDGTTDAIEVISEHALFPAGATNDDVDAQSQALQGFERAPTTAERYGNIDLS